MGDTATLRLRRLDRRGGMLDDESESESNKVKSSVRGAGGTNGACSSGGAAVGGGLLGGVRAPELGAQVLELGGKPVVRKLGMTQNLRAVSAAAT